MIPVWLFTTKAKLIGVGVLVLVLGYAYRRQIVKAEERGAAQKEVRMLADEGKRIDAAVAEKLALYARERIELDAQRTALTSQRKALLSQRDAIISEVSLEIGDLAGKGVDLETEVKNVPADALDGRIRAALARARIADSELARLRAAH